MCEHSAKLFKLQAMHIDKIHLFAKEVINMFFCVDHKRIDVLFGDKFKKTVTSFDRQVFVSFNFTFHFTCVNAHDADLELVKRVEYWDN
jgi:hypothetical protein